MDTICPYPLRGASRAEQNRTHCVLSHSGLATVRGCPHWRRTQAPICGTPRAVKHESLLGRSVCHTQFPESPCKAEQGDYVHRVGCVFAVKLHVPISQGFVLPIPPTHHPPQQRIVVYRIALDIPIPFYFLHSHSS